MSSIQVDPQELVQRLAMHPIAGPWVEVVMRDLALEQAHARIAELEAATPAADCCGRDGTEVVPNAAGGDD